MLSDQTRRSRSAGPSQIELRAHEVFRAEVHDALVELAEHCGLVVERSGHAETPTEPRGHQVAGIIGFAGEGFGGTVAIRASSSVVRRCLPSAAEVSPGELGDCIGELSNQLLGRAKNKVLRFGVRFGLTPPTYAVANELLVLGCDPQRTSWIEISTDAGPMLAMVELHGAFDVDLHIAEPIVAHAEGDMLLF